MLQLLQELYEKQLSEEMQSNSVNSIDRQVKNKEKIYLENRRNKEIRKEMITLIESIEDTETLERVLRVLKQSNKKYF